MCISVIKGIKKSNSQGMPTWDIEKAIRECTHRGRNDTCVQGQGQDFSGHP